MKHLNALVAFSVAATFSAVAQPTLNLANLNPSVGSTYVYAEAAYQPPGAGGANVTWNFATLAQGTLTTFSYVNPATAPGTSTYPGATSAWDAGSGLINYQDFDASGANELGTWFDGFGYSYYLNGVKFLSFPLTYNTNWTDTYAGTAEFFGQTNTITGSLSAQVDGWGTLILPSGTYTNVLRIRVTRDETTTGTGVTITADNEFHYYVKAGYANPLLESLDQTTVTNGGDPQVEQSLRFLVGASVGVSEVAADAGFSAWPSVTEDVVQVRANSFLSAGTVLQVLDAVGRSVLTERTAQGATHTLDLSAFAPGRYTIMVIEADGQRAALPLVKR